MSEGRSPRKRLKIVIVPEAVARSLSADARAKIEQVVATRLLAGAVEPYHRVQVEVEQTREGAPGALAVSMLRARTFTADVFRVELDQDLNVLSITPSPPAGKG